MLAYFDCFAGISGDMTLGALIDLGVPPTWLTDQLRRLPLNNFDVTATSAHRNGIQAKLVQVDAIDDHTSRNFSQVRNLIDNSPLAETVKSISLQIFQKLAYDRRFSQPIVIICVEHKLEIDFAFVKK